MVLFSIKGVFEVLGELGVLAVKNSSLEFV